MKRRMSFTEEAQKLKEFLKFHGVMIPADRTNAVELLIMQGYEPTIKEFVDSPEFWFTDHYMSKYKQTLRISQVGLKVMRSIIHSYNFSDAASSSDSDSSFEGGNLSEEEIESDSERPGHSRQNPYLVNSAHRPSQPPPRPARARRSQRNDQSRG